MSDHPSLKLAADKRERLFQVASGEFADHGFRQASLNRIISEIGMSKSSFYHYFSNKTDLFQQTLLQAMGPVLEARDAIDIDALTAENLLPTLLSAGENISRQFNETPGLDRIGRMFYRCLENPAESSLTEGIMDEIQAWAFQVLQKGQQLGVFRDDLPGPLLIQVLMSVGQSVDRWMIANWDNCSDQDHMRISAAGLDLFVRILTPAKAP